jgi:hypothetical protein
MVTPKGTQINRPATKYVRKRVITKKTPWSD